MVSKSVRQKGFTIIELMIAVTIFAVIITIITIGVLQVARQYQQASTQANLQSASRDIHQAVASSIQFSGAATIQGPASPGAWHSYCFGNVMYTYGDASAYTTTAMTVDTQFTNIPEGLYIKRLPAAPNDCDPDADPTSTGKNLLPKGAKVLLFSYDDVSGEFKTKFVLSDADLLALGTVDDTRCKASVAGSEYCAMVYSISSMTKRVNN